MPASMAASTPLGEVPTGLADRTGSITVGKAADLILIQIDDANMLPTNDIAASIVGAGHSGNVDTVLVAGVRRKYQVQLVGVDVDALREKARTSRTRLFAQPVADS